MSANSNFDIESFFGCSLSTVDDVIANKESHINRFTIPKRDGSRREILAPDEVLKGIEKSIYYKFLKMYTYNSAAHGFVPKRGIVSNAIPHVGANAVGKIDISKFFDSISTDHLKNCLFGNKNVCRHCSKYTRMLDGRCSPSLYKNVEQKFDYRCEEMKAVLIPGYCEQTGYQSLFKRIIEVCTYNGFTAQGFPTSPMLANIVMKGFDRSVTKLCAESEIVYTRYADDLTFSSSILSPAQLEELLTKKVYSLLWAYKFKPNREKTRYKSKSCRMRVCGIVVNKKLSIQKSVVRTFRAKVHHATVKNADATTKALLHSLKGWASFLMSVDKSKGSKYMKMLVDFEREKFVPSEVENVV